MSSEATGFTPQPVMLRFKPLPNDVTSETPSLKGYDYAMLQSHIVIVVPNSKKVVDINNQQ